MRDRDVELACILMALWTLLTLFALSNRLTHWQAPEKPVVELTEALEPRKPTSTPKPKQRVVNKVQECKGSKQCRTLAEALVYEARGESIAGATAVAYVILARVESPRWPDTIPDVVYMKRNGVCQFSYHCKKQKSTPKEQAWTRAYTIAYNVLNKVVDNPIPKADHYHTVSVSPRWSRKMRLVGTIDNHEFYKE